MKGKTMTGKSKVISTGKGVEPPKGMKTVAAKTGGKMMPPALLAKMKKKG
jgi:hypothetical protein